jgi:YD repeat-containing protein
MPNMRFRTQLPGTRFPIALLMGLSLLPHLVSQASVVSYTYDDAGRLVTVESSQGYKTTYALDPAGNRKTLTTVAAPTITAFTAAPASSSSNTLTWTVTETGGPGGLTYSVKRGTTTLSCTASPCTDTGLTAATGYSYTLAATDSAGTQSTAAASSTTYANPVMATLTATVVSSIAINLAWTATDTNGPGIANYKVWRGSTLLTASPITATTYSDTGLTASTAYTYTVTAYDTVGDSGSKTVSATTPALPGTPVASLSPTSGYSGDTYYLSWTVPSGTLNHYTISESINSGTPTTSTVAVPTTSQSFSGVTNGSPKIVTFQVRACETSNETACGAYSATVTETILPGCPKTGCPIEVKP